MNLELIKQRILKGIEYLDDIKPSDFTVTGVVNPNRWREYKAFIQLVKEYVNGEKKEK